MSTEAQIAANQANAQASTGPRTDQGKINSSRNGITSSLYTAGDFVRPGEESDCNTLDETLRIELAPFGRRKGFAGVDIIAPCPPERREAVATPAENSPAVALNLPSIAPVPSQRRFK